MKKKLSIFLIILITLITIPTFVNAENNLLVNENVNAREKIDNTSFVAGNTIKMSSEVDGINFVAGNDISLSSKQDHLFAAGNVINLENVITKDAFIAGSKVTITSSTVRNLYVAADKIKINSDISKNASLAGNKVTINAKIDGNVYIAAQEIIIKEETIINGTLEYPSDAKINIPNTAHIGKLKPYKPSSTPSKKSIIITTITEKIYSFLSMAVIGIILLAIAKPFFKKLEKTTLSLEEVVKQSITGFIFLIVTPVLAIILLLTVIGVPISIIILLIYVLLIYLSVIPTSYFIGKNILKDKIKNDYSILLISLVVIYILKLIPIIGSLITFISLVLGLGLFFNTCKSEMKKEK